MCNLPELVQLSNKQRSIRLEFCPFEVTKKETIAIALQSVKS